MKNKKEYCSNCKKDVKYSIRYELMEYYKETKIDVMLNIGFCKECELDMFIPELEDDNVKRILWKYKKVNRFANTSDIINLRKKYQLSVSEFAKIMEFNNIQVVHYENEGIPTEKVDNLFKSIFRNERIFVDKAKDALNKNKIDLDLYNGINSKYENSKAKVCPNCITVPNDLCAKSDEEKLAVAFG